MRINSSLNNIFISLVFGAAAIGMTSDLEAQNGNSSMSGEISVSDTPLSPTNLPGIESIKLPIYENNCETLRIPRRHLGQRFRNFFQNFRLSRMASTRTQEEKHIARLIKYDMSPATFAHECAHSVMIDALAHHNPNPEYLIEFTDHNGRTISRSGWECALIDGQVAFLKSPKHIRYANIGQAIPHFIKSSYTYKGKFEPAMNLDQRGNSPQIVAALINELSAYAIHGRVALESHDTHPYYLKMAEDKKNNVNGARTSVGETQIVGEIVFCALAMIHTIEQTPNAYENSEDKKQIYAITGHLIKECLDIYEEGLDPKRYPQFSNISNAPYSQDYIGTLLTHGAASHLRTALTKVCGDEYVTSLIVQRNNNTQAQNNLMQYDR